ITVATFNSLPPHEIYDLRLRLASYRRLRVGLQAALCENLDTQPLLRCSEASLRYLSPTVEGMRTLRRSNLLTFSLVEPCPACSTTKWFLFFALSLRIKEVTLSGRMLCEWPPGTFGVRGRGRADRADSVL